MSISSINSNLAALLAQVNIGNATTATSNNVSALSSGNRIVTASTDVAALAVGSALQSQVSTLNTVVSGLSQGSSLLQVADGGLAQIQSILQRQQAIAAQAQSGSLSDTQRGFLDQEFQGLTQQIDSLAQNTNFNGVSLLNGSIQGGTNISTNTTKGSTILPPAATIANISTTSGLSGKSVTLQVAGQTAVTFTFGSSSGQVAVGATAADSVANLAAAINNSGSAGLADYHFTSDSSGNLKAFYTGKANSISTIPTLTSSTNDSNATVVSGTGASSFSASTNIATITGSLNVGDTITVGAHTFTVAANGDATAGFAAGNNKIALGTSLSAGGVTGGALANLASYLNSAAGTAGFTDISGITFGTDTTTATSPKLTAYYSGSSSTAPTISTSYSAHSPDFLVGGTAQTADASSSVITATANTFAVGGTVTVAGASFTLVQHGATIANGAAQVDIGTGTVASTLTNIAAYLNGTTGQTALTGGALQGANFSSDSTKLYANNTNTTGSAYTGVTVTVANGILASSGAASAVGATGGSGNSGYITTGGGLYNTGGTTLITLDGTHHAANGNAIKVGNATFNFTTGSTDTTNSASLQVHASGTDATDLGVIASYLNTAAGQTASGLAGLTFKASGSTLIAYNSTDANIDLSTGNYAASTITGITGATATITGTSIAQGGQLLTSSNGASSSFPVGSTVSIGGAVVTFVPNGATPGTGQVALGTNDTNTLAALSSYLNSSAGQTYLSAQSSSLSGKHFTSDTTKLYVGNDTASQLSAPTITLGNVNSAGLQAIDTSISLASSATLNKALGIGGFSGQIGTGDIITSGIPANISSSFTAGTSTFTIGGNTITFVAANATAGANQVNLGSNNFETLSNLATYLNGSTVNAALTGNYAGFTFSTNGTNLIATNSNATSKTVGNTTLATAPTGATGFTTSGGNNVIASGSSLNVFTAGFATVKFGDGTNGTVAVGSDLQHSLNNLVTYLNANTPTGSNAVFSTNGTQLLAQNNAGSTSTITTTLTSATNPTFTGVTGQSLASTSIVGLGAGSTSAVGIPTGNLFVSASGATATNFGTAVDLSNVANNASFLGAFGGTGTIGAVKATYVSTGTTNTSGVQFSVVVGNDTYTTNTITNAALNSSTQPVTLTFNGANTTTTAAEGGSFTLTLQPQSVVTSQNSADQLASGINSGLSSVSAYQNRNVLSFNNNYSATVSGTTTGTLQGASLAFNSNSFANPLISGVSVSAPTTGTDAKISIVVNGQTYSTNAGIGNTFAVNSTITLQNTSNPSQTLTLTTGNVSVTGAASGTAVDLSSASNASAFQTALGNALGLGNANAGLTFQAGTTTSSTIGVSLASSTSSSLFSGQALDVKTQTNASNTYNQLTTALNTISSLRASVGALEERFNYATTALQNASQNEGAAKSNLLDTDVAATSTAFATSQVQLQAGIAVLAQANQLQQNLLKLI